MTINDHHATATLSAGSRGDASAVPPGHPENRASYLVAARELNRFQLGDNRVDIRDWPVFASDGRLVGAVDRFMVEMSSKKIRYVAISLVRYADHDCKPTLVGSVLVPIGVIRRLDDRHAVVLSGLVTDQLLSAPRLHACAVTRGDEDATLAVYGMPNSRELPVADFYKSQNFNEGTLAVAE